MTAVRLTRGEWVQAIRPLAPDQAVAAIGDVHGQDDLFAALRAELARDLSRAAQATFLQLGDVVDRGPRSLAALRRARQGLPGVECVTLMGNHEDRMLRALLTGDDREAALWLDFGGGATLAETGLSAADPDWRDRLRLALGARMMDWLVGLPQAHRVGDLLFIHAGIDPAVPLDRQDSETMMWVRKPFLQSPGPYPGNVAVIHGHTPQPAVALDHPHRINLDTGAFRTGVLSGLLVEGDRMQVVQALRDPLDGSACGPEGADRSLRPPRARPKARSGFQAKG